MSSDEDEVERYYPKKHPKAQPKRNNSRSSSDGNESGGRFRHASGQKKNTISSSHLFKSPKHGFNGKHYASKTREMQESPNSNYGKKRPGDTSTTQADVSQYSVMRNKQQRLNQRLQGRHQDDDEESVDSYRGHSGVMGRRLSNQRSKNREIHAHHKSHGNKSQLPNLHSKKDIIDSDSYRSGSYEKNPHKQQIKLRGNPMMSEDVHQREHHYSNVYGESRKPPSGMKHNTSNKHQLKQLLREGYEDEQTPLGKQIDKFGLPTDSYDDSNRHGVRSQKQYNIRPFNSRSKSRGQTRYVSAQRQEELYLKWKELTKALLLRAQGPGANWGKVALGQRVGIRFTPIENWQRLMVAVVKRGMIGCVNQYSTKEIVEKLGEKEEKLRRMRVLGRWKKLAHDLLERTGNQKSLKTQKRWEKLIKAMQRKGYITLKSLLDLKTGEIVEKLGEAKKKRDLLNVVGRWARITRMLLKRHERQEKGEDSDVDLHALQKKLQGEYTKVRSLKNHSRWIQLTRKLLKKEEKVHRLQVLSKWRLFARRLIAEQGDPDDFQRLNEAKMQRACRWMRLSKKLLNKAEKERSLRILGRWRSFMFRLTQKQAKLVSLSVLGKWNYFAKKLLERDTPLVTQIRWVRLVKGLSEMHPHQYYMRSFQELEVQEMIGKLKARNQKVKKMAIYGRWSTLIHGILRRDHGLPAHSQATKKEKVQALRIHGRWARLVRRLLNHDNQRIMRINCKWNMLARKLLERNRKFKVMRGEVALQRMARGLLKREKQLRAMRHQIKWQKLAKKLLQRHRVMQGTPIIERWRALIKKMARNSDLHLGNLDAFEVGDINDRLREKNKKINSLEIAGRWRRLTTEILKKYEGRGLSVSAKERKFRAFTNLSRLSRKLILRDYKLRSLQILGRWRTLTFKLLRSQNGDFKKLKPIDNWTNIVQKLLFRMQATEPANFHAFLRIDKDTIVRKFDNQKRLKLYGKWAQFARKLLELNRDELDHHHYQVKHHRSPKKTGHHPEKKISMKNAIIWRRLAWNLIKQDKQRQLRILGRWRILTNNMLMKERNRRLFVHCRLAQLIRRYITYRQRQKDLIVCGRFAMLARKIVAKYYKKGQFTASTNLARLANKLLARDRKERKLKVLGRWRILINGLMQKEEFSQPMKYTPLERWQVILSQVVYKIRTDTTKANWSECIKVVKAKHLDFNKKGHRLEILNRWARLIHGTVRKDNKKKSLRVLMKWTYLSRKLLQAEKQRKLRINCAWKRMAISILRKEKNKKLFTVCRLSALVKKYIKYRWRSKQLQVFCRLRRLAMKYVIFKANQDRLKRVARLPMLVRKYTILKQKQQSIKVYGKWFRIADRLLQRHDRAYRQKRQAENWKRIMKKLLNRRPKLSIFQLCSQENMELLKNAQERRQETSAADDVLIKNHKSHKPLHNAKEDKDFEDDQLVSHKHNKHHGLEHPPVGQVPHTIQQENAELMDENEQLKEQLLLNQNLMEQLEQEMEIKFDKFNKEVELAKQRENKLMFFIYVLKEEKKCPVSEVFEEYIKPIETSRFTSDHLADYKKILMKIQKQSKCEKIFNRALKKLKLMNGNREYKSDSCLPDSNNRQESSEPREIVAASQAPGENLGKKFLHKQQKHAKQVEEGKREQLPKKIKVKKVEKGVDKVPTLDMGQLPQKNRMVSKAFIQSSSKWAEGGINDSPYHQMTDHFHMNYTTSSEDSTQKAKIRDVVIDPAKRKRLLDSLNIITTREKWKVLNEWD